MGGIVFGLLALLRLSAYAQQADLEARLIADYKGLGQPLVQNYSPKQYQAETQNWDMVQDARGVFYFGNGDGVLEYDGSTWHLISTPNHTVVRSLAIDTRGRIYVGAKSEIGYLAPDSVGMLRYRSLLGFIPEGMRNFGRIRQITVIADKIYFQSYDFLFEWDGQKMQGWKAQKQFTFSAAWHNELYVVEEASGLLQLVQGQLVPLPATQNLMNATPVALLPNGLWLTRSKGLLDLQGNPTHTLATPLDGWLHQHELLCGTQMANGAYALGSRDAGGVIATPGGQILEVLNGASGLQDETIISIKEDRENALVLGLNNGISRVPPANLISLFGGANGIKGAVSALLRFKGSLYAATSLGLFRQKMGDSHFEKVTSMVGNCISLADGGDALLVGGDGVFALYDGTARVERIINPTTFVLCPSHKYRDCVFVGSQEGLGVLRHIDGRWRKLALKIIQDETEVRTISEAADGQLFIGTLYNGIFKIDLSSSIDSVRQVTHYGIPEGLPSLNQNNVFRVDGKVVFATTQGIYTPSIREGKALPDSRFDGLFPSGKMWVYRIRQLDGDNVLIYTYPQRTFQLGYRGTNQKFTPGIFPAMLLPQYDLADFYTDRDSLIWLACTEGAVRCRTSGVMLEKPAFNTLIRKVYLQQDSLLFGGDEFEPRKSIELPFRQASRFHFEVAATSMDNPEGTVYQYMLEGFDKSWSSWAREKVKSYTSLPHGSYTFKIRARDVYGRIGNEASFSFSILRPWYMTYWAYAFYLVVFAATVRFAVWWNNKRLEAEKHRLEGVVAKRTAELADQKGHLEQTLHELRTTQEQLVINEKMAAIVHLVDEVAHEMNTPLGVIKASTQNLVRLLPEVKQNYPTWLASLSTNLSARVIQTIETVLSARVEISTREERSVRGQLTQSLLPIAGADAEHIARKLIELGITTSEQLAYIQPMLEAPECASFVEYLHKLGRIDTMLKTISIAEAKTEKIVFTLLSYSKAPQHKKQEPVPIQDSLEKVIALHASTFRKEVKLTCYFAPHVLVMGSPDELVQLWNHLTVNALQAMNYIGELTYRVGATEKWVRVDISDTGAGIAPAYQSEIFKPFFSTKGSGEGNGLGLDLCQKIVAKHNGKISFTSQPGKTTFTIELPVLPSATEA